jgi:hypothetical protein
MGLSYFITGVHGILRAGCLLRALGNYTRMFFLLIKEEAQQRKTDTATEKDRHNTDRSPGQQEEVHLCC